MLEFAALLHDVGQHVSRKGHHRHAAYLVENGELRGFEPAEVAFLAALVRHHRRGDPKSSEARFGALSPRRPRSACGSSPRCCGSRTASTGVGGAGLRISTRLWVRTWLSFDFPTHDDAELELWGARRRRELFEKVFARELELVVGGSRVPADV